MCGIVGFDWNDDALLSKQLDLIKYRGPDQQDVFVDDCVSLAHARLSILDLSERGRQPMQKLDYVITFNGEIYNFREIREELSEYEFFSDSDTEVVVCAYDKWGPDCLRKFNGMFAFCIYDKSKRQFFLARDRFGIKPLYYVGKDGKFAFASELKALLDFLPKRDIDREALSQFFTFRFTLGKRTLVKDVLKFLPGHYMLYDVELKNIKEYERYYSLVPQKTMLSYSDCKERVRMLVEKSVERRMVSDVPVACLLSGGIDSSIIAALARRHNPGLNTFSIGFDTTNELPYARLVSEHLGTNHHEFMLDRDNVMDYLDDMVYHMDEPVGDPGFLPIFVLSEHVKEHNSVVLSGDGGDEVFCGYDRYKMLKHGLPLSRFALFDFNNDVLRRLKNMKGKGPYRAFLEVIRLFDDDELGELGVGEFDASAFWPEDGALLDSAQLFDIRTLLPGDFFMKADKMSSAFGLEQRVPFLDHELVEFALSLPERYRLKVWNEKAILKDAFKDVLPSDIVKRRKHGFDVPIDHWFKGVLGDRLRALLERSNHKLYNKEFVLGLLDRIKTKGNNYKANFFIAQKLWSILVFEIWYGGVRS